MCVLRLTDHCKGLKEATKIAASHIAPTLARNTLEVRTSHTHNSYSFLFEREHPHLHEEEGMILDQEGDDSSDRP